MEYLGYRIKGSDVSQGTGLWYIILGVWVVSIQHIWINYKKKKKKKEYCVVGTLSDKWK